MKELKVDLGERAYKILIADGLLSQAGEKISRVVSSKKGVIITNPVVGRLYLDVLRKSLSSAGFDTAVIEIKDGERYKTLKTTEEILDKMTISKIRRDEFLIALGGGVTGDIGGFAAAVYMRGIDFIQIPTTLLSQVDSSIGGKVGVNLKKGKNLAGAFYQPKIVLIDPSTLKTLPEREFKAGLAEVIKYGIIYDKGLFSFVERNLEKALRFDPAVIEKLIGVSCDIKARVVEEDERESGLRAILNFGHTIGHAIEAVTGYGEYLHGEAISIGMVCSARIAMNLGMLDKEITYRIENLLSRAGLPIKAEGLKSDGIIRHLHIDKKVKAGKLRFVLPCEIGRVSINEDIPEQIIKDSLK